MYEAPYVVGVPYRRAGKKIHSTDAVRTKIPTYPLTSFLEDKILFFGVFKVESQWERIVFILCWIWSGPLKQLSPAADIRCS